MKPLIVANWKMNPQALKGAKLLLNSIEKETRKVTNVEIVVCPPFIYLSNFFYGRGKTMIKIGAQDCFWEEKGAFTGEISAKMLKDLGCKYVIVGHSERRRYLKETDEMINKKIKAVLKIGLRPILCIEKISQIKKGIKGIIKKDLKKIILAYEPVWAIGTGKACGIPEAKKVNLSIRKILMDPSSPTSSYILYGGSINSQNARDFIKKAKFQGLLVGGASLNPKEFIKLVKNVSKT